MKRALVTGISGFVGGYLGELLASQGYEVHGTCFGDAGRVVQGLPCVLHEMDLCDSGQVMEMVASVKPDAVFHLAAQSSAALSWKKPALTVDVNLRGTVNLLEALWQSCPESAVLMIGSSEEYGQIDPSYPLVDEEYPVRPVNPYAVTKAAQNQMGALYARAYGMKIVMTRAFNHIGPRQTGPFAIPSFARQIVEIEKGLVPPVLYVGNLDAQRDFSDVRDVVRAYWLLSQKGIGGETYNIGSGTARPVGELLKMLLSLSEQKIDVQPNPQLMRPSDTPKIICNSSKLKNLTGWTPEIPLEQSLKETLDWFRQTL